MNTEQVSTRAAQAARLIPQMNFAGCVDGVAVDRAQLGPLADFADLLTPVNSLSAALGFNQRIARAVDGKEDFAWFAAHPEREAYIRPSANEEATRWSSAATVALQIMPGLVMTMPLSSEFVDGDPLETAASIGQEMEDVFCVHVARCLATRPEGFCLSLLPRYRPATNEAQARLAAQWDHERNAVLQDISRK